MKKAVANSLPLTKYKARSAGSGCCFRNWKILPGVLAFLGISLSAWGQTKISSFRLDWGIVSTARQDAVFSPFVQRGRSVQSTSLSWHRERKARFQGIELAFASIAASHAASYEYQNWPELDTSKSYPHTFSLLDFQYRLGKVFHAQKLRWHVGLVAAANMDALDFQYGRPSSFGYFMHFSVGAQGGVSFDFLKKNRVGMTLDLPIVAWVARSPYLVNDDDFIENTASHRSLQTLAAFVADGSLRSFGSFQNLKSAVFYRFRAARHWAFLLRHEFGMLQFSAPLPLRILENRTSIGAELTF